MKTIMKFGGSSVADAACMINVYQIIQRSIQEGKQPAIVLSAMKGVTNTLVGMIDERLQGNDIAEQAQLLIQKHEQVITELGLVLEEAHGELWRQLMIELHKEACVDLRSQEMLLPWRDRMLSFGERFSTIILSALLNDRGLPAEVLDARHVVLTDNNHGDAYVHYQRSYDRIRSYLAQRDKLQVITGFLGATEDGETTTLGRSGSDYSASIFGAAMNVDMIEIWTDVDGILSADPTLVENAHTIPNLTYEEAMEMAHAGARVIFPPTMIPALYKQIPIVVRNTFNPESPGSLVTKDRIQDDRVSIGISSLSHVSLMRMQGAGMVGVRGINARLFTCLAEKGISIMLVSQAFSEHSTCFALKPEETRKAIHAIETEFSVELKAKYIDKVSVSENMSLVAVVGEGMQTIPGVAGNVFAVLGELQINVEAIAQGASGRNLSFVIRDQDVKRATIGLHNRLFS